VIEGWKITVNRPAGAGRAFSSARALCVARAPSSSALVRLRSSADDAAVLHAALKQLPVAGHHEAREDRAGDAGLDERPDGVGEDLLALAVGVTDDGVDDRAVAGDAAGPLVLQQPRDLLVNGHRGRRNLGRAAVLGQRAPGRGDHRRVAHKLLRGLRQGEGIGEASLGPAFLEAVGRGEAPAPPHQNAHADAAVGGGREFVGPAVLHQDALAAAVHDPHVGKGRPAALRQVADVLSH